MLSTCYGSSPPPPRLAAFFHGRGGVRDHEDHSGGPAATVGEDSNLEFKFQLVTVKKVARLEGVGIWTLPKREEQ